MLAVPEARPAVGVKVAVRTRPVVVKPVSVPPDTAMSDAVKVARGSSLKVKLMVAVWPIFRALALLVMDKVGGVVSTVEA